MTSKIITKDTINRLVSDIKEITLNPLTDNGIYYKHDDEDMLVGYALIIPQDDTPYQYGNYLFKLKFPTNYPHSPPKVKFYTNNGKTRIHPNFYRNSKVCLSILNTWKGDQWTGCNTISSILNTISTRFTKIPLLNEPGFNIVKDREQIDNYTKCIYYQNIKTGILSILNNKNEYYFNKLDHIFKEDIISEFLKNYEAIQKNIENKKSIKDVIVNIYKMCESGSFTSLSKDLTKTYIGLKCEQALASIANNKLDQ